jgi:probable F420-dependent oxidoreductase
MRFGLNLPQRGVFDLRKDVLLIAKEAERAGYSSLWVYERVLFPLDPADGAYGMPGVPWPAGYTETADALTVLTLAAAVTETVTLGTSVLVAPFYPPLHLARALATLDQASGGRVMAGLGSSWSTDEFRAMGADFATRGKVLTDTINACRAFWAANPVSYQDERTTVGNANTSPKPVSDIPILIGGGRTLRAKKRIAQVADGWMPSQRPATTVAETWQEIQQLAADAGREPDSLQLVPRANVMLSDQPAGADRRVFTGSLDQVVEDIAAFADLSPTQFTINLAMTANSGKELLDLSLATLDKLREQGLHTL